MERFSRRGMSADMSSVACAERNPLKSFCPGDEAKLTLKDFQAIESEFAQALGYGDHQRLCGVHKNATQMHLHGAYNMIHPEKLTRHEPYRDYHKRSRVCRELERRFDPGRVPREKFTQGSIYFWMAQIWGGLQHYGWLYDIIFESILSLSQLARCDSGIFILRLN